MHTTSKRIALEVSGCPGLEANLNSFKTRALKPEPSNTLIRVSCPMLMSVINSELPSTDEG